MDTLDKRALERKIDKLDKEIDRLNEETFNLNKDGLENYDLDKSHLLSRKLHKRHRERSELYDTLHKAPKPHKDADSLAQDLVNRCGYVNSIDKVLKFRPEKKQKAVYKPIQIEEGPYAVIKTVASLEGVNIKDVVRELVKIGLNYWEADRYINGDKELTPFKEVVNEDGKPNTSFAPDLPIEKSTIPKEAYSILWEMLDE